MAFVVPAEIGHAPYAKPLLSFIASNFSDVTIVPVRHKIFADLSEDCWLLYADGFGGSTSSFFLSPMDNFGYMPSPPTLGINVSLQDWERWKHRLRPFLLSTDVLAMYRSLADGQNAVRLGEAARVGIGYVTGANDFFHLRPSQATAADIPTTLLRESVRNGRALPRTAVTRATVNAWVSRDKPLYLLHIARGDKLPRAVRRYLDSPAGEKARLTYKCRNRSPWYAVPDVSPPDAFISYMSGEGPALVANHAGCVCTNSLHAVRLTNGLRVRDLQSAWRDPFTRLSCELEGHPLGGGMLKLEPREAARVALLTSRPSSRRERVLIREGIATLRQWRHID